MEEEPEIDLTVFLARQKLEDAYTIDNLEDPVRYDADDDDIDTSLANFSITATARDTNTRKGKVQTIEWNEELEIMSREKAAADAHRGTVYDIECHGFISLTIYVDMKARFRDKIEKQTFRPAQKTQPARKQGEGLTHLPNAIIC